MDAFDPAALDCLAALADTGSFAQAAQQLGITQSAVSQRLRSLESSLGQLLVVRSRPLHFTETGTLLLRHARQIRAMRGELARALDASGRRDERVPIAVNADSLATWVLPALDPLVREGIASGFGIELVVDDQDFTHDWLRAGSVLGCVSSLAQPLQGCSATALGLMRYLAVASPGFVQRHLPLGLGREEAQRVPWLVFNRKDDMPHHWLAQAWDAPGLPVRERSVPSTEAQTRAAVQGWGLAVIPELQAREGIQAGRLQVLHPQVHVDVPLYWHQWRLADDAPSAAAAQHPKDAAGAPASEPTRVRMGRRPARSHEAVPAGSHPLSTLDRIGQALLAGARLALRQGAG